MCVCVIGLINGWSHFTLLAARLTASGLQDFGCGSRSRRGASMTCFLSRS